MKYAIWGAVCLAGVPWLTGCAPATGCVAEGVALRRDQVETTRLGRVDRDARITARNQATVYYPQGDPDESVLILRTRGPEDIRAGEEFEYTIELHNPTERTMVKNIVVSDSLSPQFELVSSTPRWSELSRRERLASATADGTASRQVTRRFVPATSALEADRVEWFIEQLAPGERVTITVRGRATDEGRWVSCATASYDLGACLAANVVAPELRLTTNIDRDFIICATDQADLELRVSNTGSGSIDQVTVVANLPQGLTHNGSQTIRQDVGSLPAGKTKVITKSLDVHAPGQYVIQASARSSGDLSTDAASTVLTAREAQLQIETQGPQVEYVGLPVEYVITVTNVGDAPAYEVMVESPVPSGTAFVDATGPGELRGDAVVWRLEELGEGESINMRVRFEGQDKGFLRAVATARSECAADVTAIARTELEGIASMVVEVVDTNDPIRVGDDEVYEIHVTNQGSAMQSNVLVAAELDHGQEFVDATGATQVRSGPGSREVVFEPVGELAPAETATWQIRVRGTNPGDKRFYVQVDSDQHGRPVRETEATKIFQ